LGKNLGPRITRANTALLQPNPNPGQLEIMLRVIARSGSIECERPLFTWFWCKVIGGLKPALTQRQEIATSPETVFVSEN
jgi:hypothetical protein